MSACAPRFVYTPLQYEDTGETLAAIECAISRRHGAAFAREAMDRDVLTRDNYPLAGRYDPWTGDVYVANDAPSARASALRHEFTHVVLDLQNGDPEPNHGQRWVDEHAGLNKAFDACWKASNERTGH